MRLGRPLEEIVGEVDDKTDKAAIDVHQIGDDTYIVQGTMNFNDLIATLMLSWEVMTLIPSLVIIDRNWGDSNATEKLSWSAKQTAYPNQ